MLKKKLILLLAVFALVVAACGDDDGGGTSPTTSPPAPPATTQAPDTPAPPATDPPDTGPTLPDLGGRTVTVGVENAYLPFNFIPIGETEGQGWDYDVWREICRLLNCEAEFVESEWPIVIDLVAQGELDTAADGISITADRAEIVAFSNAYMTVEQMFIVGLDDDRFATAQALVDDASAIVATQVGTTNEALAIDLVGADRVQSFDQFSLAVQALINGDVDAVIIDNAAGQGYVGENSESVKLIDDSLQSDPLGFIYPLGSDLVDPVNQALAYMAESGFLDDVGMVYFGDAFNVTYDDLVFPTYDE
jgi:polar amino acid transport system substrate-binding protein